MAGKRKKQKTMPVNFTIRVQKNIAPTEKLEPGYELVVQDRRDVSKTEMEVAFDAIKEVKKVHPNAAINVEVEV